MNNVSVKKIEQQSHFSDSNTVVVSNRADAHIILPPSSSSTGTSRPLGSITEIQRCVVDVSGQLPKSSASSSALPSSPSSGPPQLASLAIKGIRHSVIVCGQVEGSVHITDVQRSVIVVAGCRQFRLHDSQNVDFYLACRTRPVIEYSTGLRFAPASQIDVCISPIRVIY